MWQFSGKESNGFFGRLCSVASPEMRNLVSSGSCAAHRGHYELVLDNRSPEYCFSTLRQNTVFRCLFFDTFTCLFACASFLFSSPMCFLLTRIVIDIHVPHRRRRILIPQSASHEPCRSTGNMLFWDNIIQLVNFYFHTLPYIYFSPH
jgi:hypothetical protein